LINDIPVSAIFYIRYPFCDIRIAYLLPVSMPMDKGWQAGCYGDCAVTNRPQTRHDVVWSPPQHALLLLKSTGVKVKGEGPGNKMIHLMAYMVTKHILSRLFPMERSAIDVQRCYIVCHVSSLEERQGTTPAFQHGPIASSKHYLYWRTLSIQRSYFICYMSWNNDKANNLYTRPRAEVRRLIDRRLTI
jgi:hypothetical protein